MGLKAKPDCCEEAALGMGDAYIPCNRPATKIIATRSKTEGPYRMCDACADHSVRNRGMALIGPYVPKGVMTEIPVGRIAVAIAILWIALVCGAGYVALHFIVKFW